MMGDFEKGTYEQNPPAPPTPTPSNPEVPKNTPAEKSENKAYFGGPDETKNSEEFSSLEKSLDKPPEPPKDEDFSNMFDSDDSDQEKPIQTGNDSDSDI